MDTRRPQLLRGLRPALAAVALIAWLPAPAQTLKQLEQQERAQKEMQQLDKAVKLLDELSTELDKQTQSSKLACMRAFGLPSFCECLLENLPVAFSFHDYVLITIQSKEANQYSKMDKELQGAYDKVGPVRDKCVAQMSKR